MGDFTAGVLVSLLVTAASASGAPVSCSREGVECEVGEGNLIDAVMHVMTVEECRQMCLDQESCRFISYFDDSSAPSPNLCQLFSICDTTATCSGCVTENMACYRSQLQTEFSQSRLKQAPASQCNVKYCV